jgi:hypothetical protein
MRKRAKTTAMQQKWKKRENVKKGQTGKTDSKYRDCLKLPRHANCQSMSSIVTLCHLESFLLHCANLNSAPFPAFPEAP